MTSKVSWQDRWYTGSVTSVDSSPLVLDSPQLGGGENKMVRNVVLLLHPVSVHNLLQGLDRAGMPDAINYIWQLIQNLEITLPLLFKLGRSSYRMICCYTNTGKSRRDTRVTTIQLRTACLGHAGCVLWASVPRTTDLNVSRRRLFSALARSQKKFKQHKVTHDTCTSQRRVAVDPYSRFCLWIGYCLDPRWLFFRVPIKTYIY